MDMLSATKIEYLVAATREANCTIKFMVSRKEILPNTKMNIIEESRGAQTTNPLKYLKMHVWNLLPPNSSKTPASSTDPAIGASTWAWANQIL